MCEILAVAAGEEIEADVVLRWARAIERLGVAGFGWGMAWLQEDGVHRYRDPRSLAEDADGVAAVRGVRSRRFLVHLRRPSRLSTVRLADSQPFLAGAPDERGPGRFAFCHNGFLDRHAELRPRYEERLQGRADSEVGFALFEELLANGAAPARALTKVHERLGGTANLAYLGTDGALLVYGGHAQNPPWRFVSDGLGVAATSLHSDDESLFELLFRDAEDRRRIGRETVEVTPASRLGRRAS